MNRGRIEEILDLATINTVCASSTFLNLGVAERSSNHILCCLSTRFTKQIAVQPCCLPYFATEAPECGEAADRNGVCRKGRRPTSLSYADNKTVFGICIWHAPAKACNIYYCITFSRVFNKKNISSQARCVCATPFSVDEPHSAEFKALKAAVEFSKASVNKSYRFIVGLNMQSTLKYLRLLGI